MSLSPQLDPSAVERKRRLLCTGVHADVHFLVGQEGGEQELVLAHKIVLRMASDVFDAMFRFDEHKEKNDSSKMNNSDKVLIPDVDIEAFKTMLDFIYTDNLSGVNGKNAIDVLYAAKKYNLPMLVKACGDILIPELDNVFIAFAKARLLEEKALRWADEQCRQKDLVCSAKNRRQVLGPALFQIRFPIIQKDLLKDIVSSCVLNSAELGGVLLYNSTEDSPNSSVVPKPYPLLFSIRQRSAKSTGKLTFKIEKFFEFSKADNGKNKYSEAVYIGGFQWRILAQIKTESDTKYLRSFIYCNAENYESYWRCSCSASLHIVSQKEGKADYAKTFGKIFKSKSLNWGYPRFKSFKVIN